MARIMVVEDEPVTAADLEHKLATLGHDVSWLDTGEEAVARAQAETQDLVLMDIRLRGAMSGIDAARQLREWSDVPIVFVTAFADRDTVERACEAQPHGYLLKPFTSDSVATTVQVALARARVERSRAERERWVSEALDSAGEAVLSVDHMGAIRFANAHAEALLHLGAGDMLGKDALTIVRFADDESEALSHPLAVALHARRLTSSAGGVLLPADGSAGVRVSYSAAPICAPGAANPGAVLVFRRAPPAAHALTALDELSARLSHEINNPLTYNLGALQLAISDLDRLRALRSLDADAHPASAEQHERVLVQIASYLRDAEQGARRVAAVVRELGSFSLSAREVEPLRPRELIELAVGLSKVDAAAHVQLDLDLGHAPIVSGNKWQLAAVLGYALTSAVDALERSGLQSIELAVWLGTDARGRAEIRVTAHAQQSAAIASGGRTQPARDSSRPTSVSASVAQRVIESHGAEMTVSD